MDTDLSQESASPDPKQWRMMTKAQRIDMVECILIKHGRFNALLERIDYCARFGSEIKTKNPPCLVILGNTGAGKTTLIDTWLENAPLSNTETPEGSIIPYLYVLVPSSLKKKAALSAFLRALHDPNPSRGTEWYMITHIPDLIRKCKVQLIFVDEFQHLVDKDTRKVVHGIADFLKDLINQTNVPMILVGKLGEAELILQSNSQLDRRVGTPLVLPPFEWGRVRPETIKEFRTLMRDIDRALPLDPAGLESEEMAFRFFYASDGYLGWIMEIIREAAIRAIDTDCDSLNLSLLAAAYASNVAGTNMGEGKINPFSPQRLTPRAIKKLEDALEKRRTSVKRPAAGLAGPSRQARIKQAS